MKPTKELGHSGLETRFGRPMEDFLREWRGAQKVKNITEMLNNSPVVGALRLAIEMPIRSVDWEFISDQGEEDPRLELLNASLANLSNSWNDHVVAALLFPFYGWSMFTINYERVGGRLLWRKLKELGHETVHTWVYGENGDSLEGLQQSPHLSKTGEIIPIERMLLYRFRYNRGSPEGESILRPAYIPYYYATNMQQTEAIGIERNINGLPIVTPPMGADMSPNTSETTDYGRAHALVRNVRNDDQAGVVMPAPMGEGDHNKWHFDLVSGGGMSKVIDTDTVINRYEKRMLMAALAQFLMLGQDNVGSLALSSDQSDFFATAVNSTADIIAETFTKFAIPRLMALNGLNADGLQMIHSPAGDMNILGLADMLQKLTPNITWTSQDEMWLRSIVGMPEMTIEQIDGEKEKNAQSARAMMQRVAPVVEQDGDDMGIDAVPDLFAGQVDESEDIKTGHEKMLDGVLNKFFGKQQRRIARAANNLKKQSAAAVEGATQNAAR